MLQGKHILLGVTGGIACFKAAALASMLKKQGAIVQVIMTRNATKFVAPLTFEELTGRPVLTDTFDSRIPGKVTHIAVAAETELVLIAPATANIIGKLAHGLADDMLTTTVLACTCPKAVAPAMNTNMYENPVTQDNLSTLSRYGWHIAKPASGLLACGAEGKGRLPEPETLLDLCDYLIGHDKDLAGKRLLVTAGPTREALDPVRYLSNRSTGRMGYAIARAAARRGAQVTLVSGPTDLQPPAFVQTVPVVSAEDMFEAVSARAPEADIIIKAAAVADYRPAAVADNKLKKGEGELSIPLTRTQDILSYVGRHRRPGQFICGFSMETENMLENSRKKLVNKGLDMIAANNVKVPGAGFAVDTNVLTLITEQETRQLPLMSKEDCADALLDAILEQLS
ncbi:MAG: bifunctional phosphopantothenoylcysteine decarboxylase/phosphopantothenate--cysteine ligase CoaBC [Clostridia bacterium]|nr:bifunctional phosphopantothenoylcysteine decarboxylase/phosphopantothenate--cysteine ligase CoaBC [Clostridia bacterium]